MACSRLIPIQQRKCKREHHYMVKQTNSLAFNKTIKLKNSRSNNIRYIQTVIQVRFMGIALLQGMQSVLFLVLSLYCRCVLSGVSSSTCLFTEKQLFESLSLNQRLLFQYGTETISPFLCMYYIRMLLVLVCVHYYCMLRLHREELKTNFR